MTLADMRGGRTLEIGGGGGTRAVRDGEEWNACVAEYLPKVERMRADPEYAKRVEAEEEQERREVLEAAWPYAKAGTTTVVEPTDGGKKWRVCWGADGHPSGGIWPIVPGAGVPGRREYSTAGRSTCGVTLPCSTR